MRFVLKGLIWLFGAILALTITAAAVYSLRLAMTDWSDAARTDIEAWHALITQHHPGPVDPENPAFAETMEEARREALALADQTMDSAGYRWSLARYKAIHDDPHLFGWAVGVPATALEHWGGSYDWPGFFAGLEEDAAGNPVMRVTASGGGYEAGDQILSCDGRPISAWLDETAFAYRGSGIPARARAAAPWLFTKHGNPFITAPTACRVAGDDEIRTLTWSSISAPEWRAGAPDQRSGRGLFAHEIGEKAAWIKIPTFNNRSGDKLQSLSDAVQSDIEAIRSAPLVIFDLRGNSGGNSAWGLRFARIVWSPDYVSAFRRSGARAVDWRVSEDNIAHVRSIAEREEQEGRATAPGWAALAEGMEASLASGKALHRQTFTQRQPPRDVASPLAGRAVVLIGSACASACLDFLDLVSAFEDVTLVGEETSADTNYIEIRGGFLPGYRYRAATPIKVYRGRVRPDGGSYQPDIVWPQGLDLENDATVAFWLSEALSQTAP